MPEKPPESESPTRDLIERLRLNRGWSKSELARRANVSGADFNRFTRGVRPMRSDLLDRLLIALRSE